ncbi:hypothetical protein [Streptomyces sp. NPDC057623]|uniref:hypothetical protein n=1 Tax=Streptomyces sp. NPDC057623 TaxID=3346187 RepID=UPI0036A1D271
MDEEQRRRGARHTGLVPASGKTAGPRADADRPHTEPEPGSAQHNNVKNFFFGPVNASQPHFGIGRPVTAGGHGAATGWIDDHEVEACLDPYVEPDCFREAAQALERDGVVVLVGPTGTGKRSGAIALLAGITGNRSFVVITPDQEIRQLAERAFTRGFGYVLLDRINEAATGTEDFDWRRVRDRLRDKGAHLVVTTVHEAVGETPESVRHVRWRPPEPAEVLRTRLRRAGCGAEIVREATGALPPGCRVGEVAEAAEQIIEGSEPGQVWRRIGDGAAQPVRDWFAKERTLQEIAEITTAAFTPGASRRAFETYQEQLEPLLAGAFPQPPSPTPGAWAVASDGAGPEAATGPSGTELLPALPRPPVTDRRRSLTQNDLVVTQEQRHGSVTRTVLVFPDHQYRQWVLEELCENYSTSYWNGVRDWLTSLAGRQPDGELQMSIASGLALLARPDFEEVAEHYLDPWARGAAGQHGRHIVPLVLWCMCLDETLDATALTLARSWAESQNPGLRSTAMVAFSGQLGVRFPHDAVKWLWHLIRQGRRDADEAAVALANLFALLTECREDAGVVVDALVYRLGVQDRSRVEPRVREATLDAVMAVLTARDLRTGHPICAVLAEWNAQLLGKMAELWASALRNRPRRSSALTALRDTLRALPVTCDDPGSVADYFGRRVGTVLPSREVTLLEDALRPPVTRFFAPRSVPTWPSGSSAAQAYPARSAEGSTELTDTFLTAVLSTKD